MAKYIKGSALIGGLIAAVLVINWWRGSPEKPVAASEETEVETMGSEQAVRARITFPSPDDSVARPVAYQEPEPQAVLPEQPAEKGPEFPEDKMAAERLRQDRILAEQRDKIEEQKWMATRYLRDPEEMLERLQQLSPELQNEVQKQIAQLENLAPLRDMLFEQAERFEDLNRPLPPRLEEQLDQLADLEEQVMSELLDKPGLVERLEALSPPDPDDRTAEFEFGKRASH